MTINLKLKPMEDSTKLMAGILAGLAVGAALGLLLAPEKGSDTREQISGSLNELGEKFKEKVASQIDALTEKVSALKSQTR